MGVGVGIAEGRAGHIVSRSRDVAIMRRDPCTVLMRPKEGKRVCYPEIAVFFHAVRILGSVLHAKPSPNVDMVGLGVTAYERCAHGARYQH